MIKRILATAGIVAIGGVAALGLGAPIAQAQTSGGDTADSYWYCTYKYNAAQTKVLGSACYHGARTRVCDMEGDGRYITGVFIFRGIGTRSYTDSNGYGGGCAYRTYQHNVSGEYVQ